MGCTPYARQTRAALTLFLVKALLIALDEDPDPVFWPNPRGRVGRTKPGETATQRQSRPRGLGGGKNGGGGDHHHRCGGDRAPGAGVPEGAAEGATLVQQPGQLAAALAEVTEGGRMARDDVQHGTARQPPPARLRPRARTTARWSW